MKLWIDDVRPAPAGYAWAKTVERAKEIIISNEELLKVNNGKSNYTIELIDVDHDAGDYGPPDYIVLLDWLEETGRNYPIRIHSMNPVGVENMRRIIQKNGWTEVR
jgi:hypothetical protein